MPEGARSFRQLAHNTCVEVLMYMSPSHAQNILDSVATNLNCTYLRFVRRHGEFSGRISILAYSLGSVLCYDLLAHQPVPRESAPARAFQHLAALHERAQVERHRRQEAAATAELEGAGEAGSGTVRSSGDGDDKAPRSPARSRWMSYWGLLKKPMAAGGSPASHRRPAKGGADSVKSLPSTASNEDPVVKILDDAAASMQADASMWQAHSKLDDGQSDNGRGPFRDEVREPPGNKAGDDGKRVDGTEPAQRGFPPQRWFGKLARKLEQVRTRTKRCDSASPARGEGSQEPGQGGAADSAALSDHDRGHSNGVAEGGANVASPRPNTADPPGSPCESPPWRGDPEGNAAAQPRVAGDSVFGDAPAGHEADGGSDAHIAPARMHGAASDSVAEVTPRPAGGSPVAPARAGSCESLAGEGSPGRTMAADADQALLQRQLDGLQAQAAATAAQISLLQAQLVTPGTAAAEACCPLGLGGGQVSLQRSSSNLCLPAEAPHSMVPEQSMGLPPEAAAFHTYGMGQVREGGEAVSPLPQPAAEGDPKRQSQERIAQTRLLWPGSTLHQLDSRQQQPLTMQSLRYPVRPCRARMRLPETLPTCVHHGWSCSASEQWCGRVLEPASQSRLVQVYLTRRLRCPLTPSLS